MMLRVMAIGGLNMVPVVDRVIPATTLSVSSMPSASHFRYEDGGGCFCWGLWELCCCLSWPLVWFENTTPLPLPDSPFNITVGGNNDAVRSSPSMLSSYSEKKPPLAVLRLLVVGVLVRRRPPERGGGNSRSVRGGLLIVSFWLRFFFMEDHFFPRCVFRCCFFCRLRSSFEAHEEVAEFESECTALPLALSMLGIRCRLR